MSLPDHLPADFPRYITTEHLTGTMFEYGRYTLSYQPPEGAAEADVSMSISSEADLTQMLRFFEGFLQAAGYVIEGKELTLERTAPDFSSVPDKWHHAKMRYPAGAIPPWSYEG
jgi:hypothetical protein